MPDAYTAKKLAVQSTFEIGTLAVYSGQRKALHGTVKIVGHEKRGALIVEVDGATATVSPFSLTPVAAARPRGFGKRPEGQRHGQAPTSRRSTRSSPQPAQIYRNGVPVPPAAARVGPSPGREPVPLVESVPQDREVEVEAVPRQAPSSSTKDISAPSLPSRPAERTVKLNGLAPAPPSADACRSLLERWLRTFRMHRTRGNRQAIIDHFDLGAWLDRVPTPPTPDWYKQTVYYVAAAMLQRPAALPEPAEALDQIARRFPVDKVAVNAHVEWMVAKLSADHAKFLAHRAAIGVDV